MCVYEQEGGGGCKKSFCRKELKGGSWGVWIRRPSVRTQAPTERNNRDLCAAASQQLNWGFWVSVIKKLWYVWFQLWIIANKLLSNVWLTSLEAVRLNRETLLFISEWFMCVSLSSSWFCLFVLRRLIIVIIICLLKPDTGNINHPDTLHSQNYTCLFWSSCHVEILCTHLHLLPKVARKHALVL